MALAFYRRNDNAGSVPGLSEEVPRDQKFIPTIYRANFRDSSSFFFAQSFPMRHKDIIYVSNADTVEASKCLEFLRTITSTESGVPKDNLVTRETLRALRD